MTIASWFLCPLKWRRNEVIRRRLRYCILLFYVMSFIEISYKLIAELFIWVPQKHQWFLAIVLVLVREMNGWVLSKIVHQISGPDDISTDIIATHFASARHALFLSIVLGSLATNETSCIILVYDFIINMYLSFRIVYLNNKRTEKHAKQKIASIQTLIINETVEFMMPIAYGISITMGYYGPSAQVLGNIKNSYWHYSAINNMETTIQWLSILFLVDFTSVILSVLLLIIVCKINPVKIYFQLQKETWQVLAMHQAYLLEEVCYSTR